MDLAKFDLKAGAPVMILDPDNIDLAGNVSAKFQKTRKCRSELHISSLDHHRPEQQDDRGGELQRREVVATTTIVEATSAGSLGRFTLSTLSVPAATFEALRWRVSATRTDRCR